MIFLEFGINVDSNKNPTSEGGVQKSSKGTG